MTAVALIPSVLADIRPHSTTSTPTPNRPTRRHPRDDPRGEDVGEDVGVAVGVVECGL